MRKAGVLCLLLFLPAVAWADPVRIGFTVTINTAVGAEDVFGAPLGQHLTGTLTYDPLSAEGSISVAERLTVPLTHIGITDDYPCDLEGGRLCDLFDAFFSGTRPGFESFHVGLTLPEPLGRYEEMGLPRSPAEFVRFFQFGSFSLMALRTGAIPAPPWGTHSTIITGFVETHAPVPEPGSMLLLGTGLLGVLRTVRKRSRQCRLFSGGGRCSTTQH